MIQAKNLDNQNFEDITQRAVSRIPNYSDNWTNFNLSDPGITLLDLFAWYKEMEQYEINFYSEAIAERLLRLTGIERLKTRPAECMIHIPEDMKKAYPRYSRLETKEGIVFETDEEIPEIIPAIKGVYIRKKDGETDVGNILNEGVGIHPFEEYGDRNSGLVLEFDYLSSKTIGVTFDIAELTKGHRNPPDDLSEAPRTLFWHWEGSSENCMLSDETNALSKSGRIFFRVMGKRLIGSLIEPGCEEEVVIKRINCGDYKAIQKRTVAKTEYIRVERKADKRIEFDAIPIGDIGLNLFLRTKKGWKQINYEGEYTSEYRLKGCRFDTREAVDDGKENLRISFAEALIHEELFYDSTGMPGQEIQLTFHGKIPLEESFMLICDTVMEDGSISEEEWRECPDFYSADSRSRVFIYDRENEKIIFGDGKRGAIVPRGEKAIVIASMELSEGAGGNIPRNAGLKFIDEEFEVENREAYFGRDREKIKDMMMRCRKRINNTKKCVTVDDFERAALETPGLRVGYARAVPGFDRQEPTKVSRYPVVSVVVIPDSDSTLPMPDERFLRAVRRNIEDRRIIGTLIRVTGPVYIGIDIRIEAVSSGIVPKEAVEEKIIELLKLGKHRQIGDPVFEGDIESAVCEIDDIESVRRIEISTSSAECYKDAYGYMEIPKDGVPWLKSLKFRS